MRDIAIALRMVRDLQPGSDAENGRMDKRELNSTQNKYAWQLKVDYKTEHQQQ